MQDFFQEASKAVAKHYQTAVKLSNDLAENPELSDEEFESSRKIVEILKNNRFDVEYPFKSFDTAFCAKLKNGEGPSIAILAEYDALPEIGHACGHNISGSLSVLAALALTELKDLFKGTVYVIGTPAEETRGAKIELSKMGVFDDMDAAFMMHCSSGGICEPNFDALSLRGYSFEFHGKTAHAAASPWMGKSALAAARKFLDLVDARRECFTPDIRFNGIFVDGGKAPNIIPDHAEVFIEFRASSKANLNSLDDATMKCANAAAMALDCTVTFKRSEGDYDDMVRISTLENEMSQILTSIGEKVRPIQAPLGSSDIGNVSYRCPTIHPMISITDDKFPLHTVEFAQATIKPGAYKALENGATALALFSLKILNDSEFRMQIQDEFEQQLNLKQGLE